MISIIIPVYNQAEKLIVALRSIDQQVDVDYEVIIVNDGSNDNPEQVFADYYKKINNDRHYLFLNQEHRGAPAARNYGYTKSKGEYLFFCDADAILKPKALSILLGFLINNPSASYTYSSFYWGRKLFKVGEFKAEKLRQGPYIHTMALIRRQDFPQEAWDERLKKFQDWDLWLTMLEQGKSGYWVKEVLFSISSGGSMSSWLPTWAYKVLPFLPSVKRYKAAEKIIREKHGLF